jgi:rubrerythrin
MLMQIPALTGVMLSSGTEYLGISKSGEIAIMKVKDASGHEHAANGQFGSGGSSAAKPKGKESAGAKHKRNQQARRAEGAGQSTLGGGKAIQTLLGGGSALDKLGEVTDEHATKPKIGNITESYLGIKDGSSFHAPTEKKIISSAIESNTRLWADNSKEVKYLKARDGVSDAPVLGDLETHVIYDDTPEYFGRGVAHGGAGHGPPGLKMWWNPYTKKDRFSKIPEYLQTDFNMDPVAVLSHELHHAFGHDNELDLMSRAGAYQAHQDMGWKHAGDGIKSGMDEDLRHLWSKGKDKLQAQDSAAIIRTLINRDERGFEKFLLDNKLVNNPAEHDYFRFSDVKEKAFAIKLPTVPKHKDTSALADVLWRTASQKSLDYSDIHTPRLGGSTMKPDEDEMQDEGEEELEKEGSDLDFVKERLADESGGVEALSQALEGIQDPKLKEIMAAIHEDEQKHQAALERMQENGGGEDDAREEAPAEEADDGTEKDEDGPPEIPEEDDGGKSDLIDQIRAILEAHDDEMEKADGPCDEEDTEKSDDGDEDDKPDFLKEDDEEEEDGKITKSFRVPIIKGDKDQQICYGIVSEPDTVDLQGDRLSESEIRKACHKFMQKSQQINKEHEGPAKADIIESYIAPVGFTCGGQTVRKGSWVMAVKIHDKSLWDAVKKGEITGFSIAGQGERTPFS